MPDAPRVSIITAVYNSSRTVEECLDSVARQTLSNWEHILVDDCSDDGSWEVLQRAAQKDPRIRIHRLPNNGGAGIARNRAIEMASGRFIAFLDSDDRWLPEKLEVQVSMMEKNNWVLSYGDYLKFGDRDQPRRLVHAPAFVDYERMLKSNFIGCLTAMYDSQQLGKRYMPTIRRRQDWGLWLSILREGHLAHSIQKCLAEYRVQSNSLSGNKWTAMSDTWRFYRQTLGMSREQALVPFVSYLYYGYRKFSL